jgi:hypothetical protein
MLPPTPFTMQLTQREDPYKAGGYAIRKCWSENKKIPASRHLNEKFNEH